VQIISGLTEGEQVLLNPPRLLEGAAGQAFAQAKEGSRQAEEPTSEPIIAERAGRVQSDDRGVGMVSGGERRSGRSQRGERGQRSSSDGSDDSGSQGSRGGMGGMAGFPNLSQEEIAKLKQRWESMSPEEREKEKEKIMSQMREKFGQSGAGLPDQQNSSGRGRQERNQPEQKQASE
jgi:hypothetical protein